MKYAFFIGCTTLARLEGYEQSTRKVAELLGIELVDMPGSSCCGTTYLEALDHRTALTVAARNICIAEELGLDILTICNGCTEVLTKANQALIEDPKLRDEVNEILSDLGRQFKGTIDIKHLVKVLKEDFTLDKLETLVEHPLKGLKVAAHYGCHLLRPSDVMLYDNPEAPKIVDELIEVTGAKNVAYPNKMVCCTAPVLGIREEVTWSVSLEKIKTVKDYADILVTVCPFCYITYEQCQFMAEVSPGVPIVHYPQLLGLSLGINSEELGLEKNRIDTSSLQGFLER